MLGYSPQELRTLTYRELTPERWHAIEDLIVREQIIPRGYSDVYEKEYRRKDATIIPVELRTILSYDAAGLPSAMWAIVRDITERKQADESLRLSEQKFSMAFANNPAAIALTRLEDGLFLDVNDTWVALNGYSQDEVIGRFSRTMHIWPTAEIAASFVQELREKDCLRG